MQAGENFVNPEPCRRTGASSLLFSPNGAADSSPRLARGGWFSLDISHRDRLEWVAQATRLCRSATRRPKGEGARYLQKAVTPPVVIVDLPTGQWPGGTGE